MRALYCAQVRYIFLALAWLEEMLFRRERLLMHEHKAHKKVSKFVMFFL